MAQFPAWWERYPERLEHERLALDRLGVAVREDEQARAVGVIKWTLVAHDELTGCGDVELVVTFPEFYPFLRPVVAAPGLSLGHHQHPFGKNLCLIGRASSAWDTRNDLAWLLREQLRKALELGAADERGGDEEDQGEPFSEYYQYSANAMVLVDGAWEPPAEPRRGVALLAINAPLPLRADSNSVFIAETVTDADGAEWFRTPAEILENCEQWGRKQAQWIHVAEPLPTSELDAMWEAADTAVGTIPRALTDRQSGLALRLISFPEEHSRDSAGLGWVLLIRQVERAQAPAAKRRSGNPSVRPPSPSHSYDLVRAGRAGPADMRARLGVDLALSRVLLIGAGAIGSVIADQLARAGVGALRVIDHDVLEPGNLVRHANTLALVGAYKASAAAALARQANPYVDASGHVLAVGSEALAGQQRAFIHEEYAEADLVIDASAEVGVMRLTAFLAREAGRPWIGAWGTNGARGGAVVRIRSSSDWCFSCFEWSRRDDERLSPPASDAPLTQPVGCAEPTFIGSNFNLSEVALHAVRTASAVLTGAASHDVSILSFEHPSGADVPIWDVASVTRHGECQHR